MDDVEVSYSEEGLPVLREVSSDKMSSKSSKTSGSTCHKSCGTREKLTAIYQVDGTTCDVYLTDDSITWSTVNGKAFKTKNKRSKKTSKVLTEETVDQCCCIKIKDIIGIKIHRRRMGNQKPGEGICLGFCVFTFVRKDACRWREKTYLFGHPSEDLCLAWCRRIEGLLKEFKERPKKIKVFLQPFAGKKYSRILYQQVAPIFDTAGITDEVIEVNCEDHMRKAVQEMDLSQYDSVVVVGGDGSVSRLVSTLLSRTQDDHDVDCRPSFVPRRSSTPVGIIPAGTFNHIAHSMYGTDDLITATRYITLGLRRSVNVCSIFRDDEFWQWAFNGHYGFFGSVLPFLHRYSMLGEKKVEMSFLKALTKAKFRSYECEVEYIPLSDTSDHTTCHQRCARCTVDMTSGGTFSDEVHELSPLETSNGSSIINDLTEKSPFKSIKGDFINVSVFSLPAYSNLSPLGMSPFSHLNDGLIDLVMVNNADKKEFVRFLKRHGNHKDQFDLPFVETVRAKEVKVQLRFRETWKHNDPGYSEINYEMEHRGQRKMSQVTEVTNMKVIDELKDSESEEEEEVEEEDSDEEMTSISDSQKKDKKLSKKERKSGWARTNGAFKSSLDETEEGSAPQKSGTWTTESIQESTDTVMAVSDSYRPTIPELERARRGKDQKKKEKKKKAKAEARMKALWNIDNEVCSYQKLHFKCHQGLVMLYGLGVPEHFDTDDVSMGCLNIA